MKTYRHLVIEVSILTRLTSLQKLISKTAKTNKPSSFQRKLMSQ